MREGHFSWIEGVFFCLFVSKDNFINHFCGVSIFVGKGYPRKL